MILLFRQLRFVCELYYIIFKCIYKYLPNKNPYFVLGQRDSSFQHQSKSAFRQARSHSLQGQQRSVFPFFLLFILASNRQEYALRKKKRDGY